MIISLRVHCAELQIVLRKEGFTVQPLSQDTVLASFGLFFVFSGRRIVAACIVVGYFHEGVEVEDEGLEVLGAFIELPDLLVAAGDVVEDVDDDVLVDGFAAAGRVFQYLFCLVEVDEGFLRPFDVDALLRVAAQLDHPF
jgi:hypothetical protein